MVTVGWGRFWGVEGWYSRKIRHKNKRHCTHRVFVEDGHGAGARRTVLYRSAASKREARPRKNALALTAPTKVPTCFSRHSVAIRRRREPARHTEFPDVLVAHKEAIGYSSSKSIVKPFPTRHGLKHRVVNSPPPKKLIINYRVLLLFVCLCTEKKCWMNNKI